MDLVRLRLTFFRVPGGTMSFFSWYTASIDRAPDEFTDTEDDVGSQLTSCNSLFLQNQFLLLGDVRIGQTIQIHRTVTNAVFFKECLSEH